MEVPSQSLTLPIEISLSSTLPCHPALPWLVLGPSRRQQGLVGIAAGKAYDSGRTILSTRLALSSLQSKMNRVLYAWFVTSDATGTTTWLSSESISWIPYLTSFSPKAIPVSTCHIALKPASRSGEWGNWTRTNAWWNHHCSACVAWEGKMGKWQEWYKSAYGHLA